VTFPPVTVWFYGTDYWLSDGFHRVAAATRVGKKSIAATIVRGSLEDARWFSLAANSQHGLRRNSSDIRFAVNRALSHRRATGMSVNRLAKHLGLPEPTLRRWIKKLEPPKELPREMVQAATTSAGDVGCRCVPLLREQHRVFHELNHLKSSARCAETAAVVNVLVKWLLGVATRQRTVDAIDRLFRGGASRAHEEA
jgi:ParB-like chromosome segregation protein Spo0J